MLLKSFEGSERMKIKADIITTYINHQTKPDSTSWFYQVTKGTGLLLDHRQEVCKALLDECNKYKEFPLWNQALLCQMFPNINKETQDMILYPIIGTNEDFDICIASQENNTYVLIDLLHIADHAETLKQMTYLLHHLIHEQVLRYYFSLHQPKQCSYLEALEHRFFYEGLVQYMAWNEDHSQYVFHNPSYKHKKEKAFTLLYQIMQIDDVNSQATISNILETADFWDRCPEIAGLFFLDDLYHEYGDEALTQWIKQTPDGILSHVFQE